MQLIDMTTEQSSIEAPMPDDSIKIRLNTKQLVALGLTGSMELGKEFMIQAKVCVVEAEMEDGMPEMTLKVKSMGVQEDGENDDGEVRDAPSGKVSQGKLKSVMGFYGG
jgi:hypothetical protein